MPLLIPYIDELTAANRRGAVTIQFDSPGKKLLVPPEQDAVRQYILSWLVDQEIEFQPCGPFSDSGRIEGYSGEVYVDLSWDEDDPKFKKLYDLLYNWKGRPRVDGIQLILYPYP